MNRKIKNFIANHWQAILVSIAVALVAGLPQVIARNMIGDQYQGIPYLVANDSEPEYVARIQEILDGHWAVSSPMLYEYKDSSVALMPPVGELLFYVLPLKLLGISLNSMIFLSKFLYPGLLFFIIYLFISSVLIREDKIARLSAIAGSLFGVIGYEVINIRRLIAYLSGEASSTLLLWTRPVNPIAGAILLFALLYCLSRIVKEQGGYKVIAAATLILAAMSGYIFSFALGLTIPIVLSVLFIFQKDWKTAKRVGIPVIGALMINGVYLVDVFWALRGHTLLSDPRKTGMFFTHQPAMNIIAWGTLIIATVCFLLFFKKEPVLDREKRWWFVVLAIAGSCVVVYLQQVVTGRAVWPQHFVQYTKPLAVTLLMILGHNILRFRVKYIWQIFLAVIFLVCAFVGWRMLTTVGRTTAQYTETQSFAGVINYLNTHAAKDCVVYVSSDPFDQTLNRFIPALTSCNNYHTYYLYNGVPAERIMHNYMVELRLSGLKTSDIKAYYNEQPFYTTSYFFRDWGDMLCCENDSWLSKVSSKSEIDQWFMDTEKLVERNYSEYLKRDLYSELALYRLDYFVVDTLKQPHVNEKNYPFLSNRQNFGRYALYSVVAPKK